jgi:hypothetical protein
MKFKRLFLILSCAAALASCGGGGDDVATTDFPLAAAYRANLVASRATSFDISGTCAGTGTRFVTAPAPGTFEGAPALVKTITATNNYTNCPGSGTVTSQDFYDTDYVVKGFVTPGQSYSSFADKVVVPEAVRIGNSGVFGSAKTWTDSSRTFQIGTGTYSYVVEADGASTTSVIAKLVTRFVDTSNAPVFTETETYRLTASGWLTLLVDDVVRADGSRLTLTVK